MAQETVHRWRVQCRVLEWVQEGAGRARVQRGILEGFPLRVDEAIVAVWRFLEDQGLAGAMFVFIVGLKLEWWVMGGQYRDLKPWRDAALRERALSRTAVEAVEAVAQ